MEINVEGKRGREKLKKRWIDRIDCGAEKTGVNKGEGGLNPLR